MVWDGGLEVSVGGSEGAISAVVLSCLLALLFFISPFEFAFGMFIIFISLAMNAKLPNETKTATKRQTKDAGLRTTDAGLWSRESVFQTKDQAHKYAKQSEDSWRSKSRRKV